MGFESRVQRSRISVRVSRRPARDASESRAESAARDWARGDRSAPVGSVDGSLVPRHLAAKLARRDSRGAHLPEPLAAEADARYGANTAAARIHTDPDAARLAAGIGANAVTIGSDIFFGAGRYAPETAEGERLLAHELAHVAQQGGEPRAVQGDLAQSEAVTLGTFEIDLQTQTATATSNAGLMGTIKFHPDPNGPYSAEIGLIQAVNVTDVAGVTSGTPGTPLDWSRDVPGGANPEAARMELMTTGLGAAPPGWFIDASTARNPRGSEIGPNYIQHFHSPPPANQFGWLRSPTDLGPASLWDFPNSPHDTNFDFETVAKGTDNQTIYGSLFWGFQIRSRAVAAGSEYAKAQDAASPTFEEALERFRGFYVHEPVVLYFDTNDPIPRAGEEAKLADLPDYLARYPDVMVRIDGYADVRGSEAHNLDLSQQRADAAANLLTLQGVDASRIDPTWVIGWGETQDFSQHGTAPGAAQPLTAGRLQANRRVVISFTHTVSNHPIVMP
jgi:outer membrane protein OmpA-like peptidoglycan-associated protein